MTGTKASLKIVSTHRDNTPSGKAGCVTPADSPASPKPKLLDQLREALHSRHYSRRTEQTYCHWVNEITVRDGKGAKDRMTMLPESLKLPLQEHLLKVRKIY
jgi:hypothetical protein